MSPSDVTSALTAAINQGGEQFLENTLAVMLPILWLTVIALHLARPYMLQMVQKFTLRIGADIWWALYVGLRDLMIGVTFIMSVMFFFPDVVVADPLPITGGLAAVCLLGALLVKLMYDIDEDKRAFLIASNLLGLGSLLYLVPTVLGMQATNGGAVGFWNDLATALTSNSNPVWAVGFTYVSLVLATILGIIAINYALRQTRATAPGQASR